jgi:hypothetical protein
MGDGATLLVYRTQCHSICHRPLWRIEPTQCLDRPDVPGVDASAVNINLVAFLFFLSHLGGQIFAIFVITVTAAEVAVALAIVIAYVRHKGSLKIDEISIMKG